MKNTKFSSRGNAVLISVAITGFLFLAAAGASKVILGSLRDSPKIVESSEALYAAESAMEAALYDAKNRGTGYSTTAGTAAGQDAFVGLNNINSASGSWEVNGQTEMDRGRTSTGDVLDYDWTFFMPPRKVLNSNIELENLSNWRKVRMGEQVTFDLFVDTGSNTAVPLHLGDGIPVPAPDTATTCTGVQGPNGMCSTNTKSIIGINATNSDLKNVFIDLFIPAIKLEDRTDNPILLSWQVETRTDAPNIPQTLNLVSSDSCTGNVLNAGVICYKHFDENTTSGTTGPVQHVESGIANSNHGMWVRLDNPGGLLTLGNVSDPSVESTSLTSFFRREGHGTLFEANYYFPKLILQIGQPVQGKKDTTTSDFQTIQEAYVRVGFKVEDTANISDLKTNFPLPDDKVTINATGASGVVKKGVQAEIHPQEGAPMFDYSVFQP